MTTGAEYRITLAANLEGGNPLQAQIDPKLFSARGHSVHVGLDDVRFARPSGLAFVYVLVYTLVDLGHRVSLSEPRDENVRTYIRRTDFWSVLSRYGFTVPDALRGFNLGQAPGLIECSVLTTNAGLDENMQSTLISYDRLRTAMARAGLQGRDRAASVFAELAGNAAEHSRSERGAFAAAQAYPHLGLIEIAIADCGIGIRTALNDDRLMSDTDAIRAALQEGVTGRRDAVGNPLEGGFGLPTALEESSSLLVRSGTALVRARTDPNAIPELEVNFVAPLLGTIVIANVSS
jgi:hypothetical protein